MTTRVAEAAQGRRLPLSRPDRGRRRDATHQAAGRGGCHRLHPAVRAGAGLHLDRRRRPDPALRQARHRQAARRRAAAVPLERAQLQPDLEHGRRHQRVLRAVRGDRQWQPARGAAAGGARGVLARRRHLRGLQHLGRPRHAGRDAAGQRAQSQLQDHPLSRPLPDHARAARRSAPARPPRRAEGYPRARAADDVAGRRHRVRHGQRPRRAAGSCRRPTPTRSTRARWRAACCRRSRSPRHRASAPCSTCWPRALPQAGFVRQEHVPLPAFLANRFGRAYLRSLDGTSLHRT